MWWRSNHKLLWPQCLHPPEDGSSPDLDVARAITLKYHNLAILCTFFLNEPGAVTTRPSSWRLLSTPSNISRKKNRFLVPAIHVELPNLGYCLARDVYPFLVHAFIAARTKVAKQNCITQVVFFPNSIVIFESNLRLDTDMYYPIESLSTRKIQSGTKRTRQRTPTSLRFPGTYKLRKVRRVTDSRKSR